MATYSDTSFDANRYNSRRPNYPDQFYESLLKYHGDARALAVDVGTGSGFVAFKLAEYFDKVIGTDISPVMISQCNSDSKKNSKVEFKVAPAEDLSSIESNSVDLVTGAECLHWVDQEAFYKEAHRILKPGGTLAFWFYVDPIFIGHPKANKINDLYTYDDFLGPYWEQPGKNILREMMRNQPVPAAFKDVVVNEYQPEKDERNKSTLFMRRTWTVKALQQYVESWSAYHAWKKSNEGDIAQMWVDELKKQMGWDDGFQFEVIWSTVYTFARK